MSAHCLAAGSVPSNASVPRVSIVYSAPADCPNRVQVLAAIASRVTTTQLDDGATVTRRVRLSVEPTPDGFVARMEYADETGQVVTRSMDAPDCAQAAYGIALVTAIAIESADTPVPSAALESGAKKGEPGAAAAQQAPTNQRPPPTATVSQVEQPRQGTARNLASEPLVSAPLVQELGVFAGATLGVGPRVAIGGGVLWGLGRDEFPWLRVFASWYQYDETTGTQATYTSHFRLLSITPSACSGSHLKHDRAWVVALCGGFELGQYVAEAKTEAPTQFRAAAASHLFWAAGQISLPFRLVQRSLVFELQPVLRLPLVSGYFVEKTGNNSSGDHRGFEIPRFALGLNLAAGMTF